MVERADSDNDGLISEEEFYNIITKKTFAAWSINNLFLWWWIYSHLLFIALFLLF